MPCKREARFRRNTIAFWLSDEEKKQVEAKIILSGLTKGEYYRSAVLGQQINVSGGRYLSARLAVTLEKLYADAADGDTASAETLEELLGQLLTIWEKRKEEFD